MPGWGLVGNRNRIGLSLVSQDLQGLIMREGARTDDLLGHRMAACLIKMELQ